MAKAGNVVQVYNHQAGTLVQGKTRNPSATSVGELHLLRRPPPNPLFFFFFSDGHARSLILPRHRSPPLPIENGEHGSGGGVGEGVPALPRLPNYPPGLRGRARHRPRPRVRGGEGDGLGVLLLHPRFRLRQAARPPPIPQALLLLALRRRVPPRACEVGGFRFEVLRCVCGEVGAEGEGCGLLRSVWERVVAEIGGVDALVWCDFFCFGAIANML